MREYGWVLWSLELASEYFHHFFAYDFGEEESRLSDLQAWIVEGRISRRLRSRLGRNSASRKSNPISRDIEEFGSVHRKLGYEDSLLVSAWKSRIQPSLQTRNFRRITVTRDARMGKNLALRKWNMVTKNWRGNPGFSWATFQRSRARSRLGRNLEWRKVNFVANCDRNVDRYFVSVYFS